MIHVGPAFAQGTGDQAGVGIQPLDTKPTDPNEGQWFFKTGSPGDVLTFRARLVNPATAERKVKIYLADLNFANDGTPQIPTDPNDSVDIGKWGAFTQPEYTLAPNSAQDLEFRVTVPQSADPGDHVGVVVIENEPQANPGSAFNIIKRVSTRLYVTVPGDAVPAYKIESVKVEPDSKWFPREATLRIQLRNTGRVAVRPTVKVGGQPANGPSLMLTKSIENFVVTKKVPIWGGPQAYRVDVTSFAGATGERLGPAEQLRVSRFYIPWVLLAALAVLLTLFVLVRRWMRRRVGKYAAIRADMKRIERLLEEQRAGTARGTEDEPDPEEAIKAAMKRAQRAGDERAVGRLESKLEDVKARAAESQAASPPPAPPPSRPVVETPPPTPPPTPPVEVSTPARSGVVFEDRRPTSSPQAAAPTPAAPTPAAPTATPAPTPAPAHDPGSAPAEPARNNEALAAILREIPNASGERRDALIAAAQTFGPAALGAHDDLVGALPIDVRLTLLRGAFARPTNQPPTQ